MAKKNTKDTENKKVNNKQNNPKKVNKKPEVKKDLPKVKEEVKPVEEVKEVVEEKVEETKVEEIKVEETKVEEEKKEESVLPVVEEVVTPVVEEVKDNNDTGYINVKGESYRNKIDYYFKPALIFGGIVLLLVFLISTISSPRNIFKAYINTTFDYFDDALELFNDQYDKSINFNTSFNLEGNNIDVKDYEFVLDVNAQPKESVYNGKISLNKDKESIDGTLYIQDGEVYLNSSVLDKPLDITNYMDLDDEIFEVIEDSLKEVKKNTEYYEIVSKKARKEILKHLDSDQIEKDSEKRSINNKTYKLKKISYEFDEEYLKETVREICEDLLEDDEFIRALSKITDLDKSEIKDGIKEIKSEIKEIDLDDSIKINIFTKGITNTVVGYSLEYDDDEIISLLYYKDNLEFIYDDGLDKITAMGEPVKEGMEVVVKVEKEKVATLTVKELDEDEFDIDYIIYDGDDKIKGNVMLSTKNKTNSGKGDYSFSVRVDDNYVKVSGKYTYEFKKSLSKLNIKSAVDYEDADYEEIKSDIKSKVKDDDIEKVLLGIVDDLESDALDLNYIGMKEVDYEEAKKLLNNKKPTVLYIGDTYYSSYSEKLEYEFLENIEDLQDELLFHSNYLDSYDSYIYNDECGYYDYDCDYYLYFQDLLPKNKNCVDVDTYNDCGYDYDEPLLVLINDGEVISVLDKNNTKDDMISALSSIGIGNRIIKN